MVHSGKALQTALTLLSFFLDTLRRGDEPIKWDLSVFQTQFPAQFLFLISYSTHLSPVCFTAHLANPDKEDKII